jgi:sodium/bile acid cotransporter 7
VLKFVTKYKVELSLFSTSNLLCIVWMALSTSSKLLLKQNAGTIFLVILAAIVFHVSLLVLNYVVALKIFRMSLPEAISVIIMTSQKSSPVALAVISYITHNPDQKGLFAVPCIIGQLIQIFIGSFVAKQFAKLITASSD